MPLFGLENNFLISINISVNNLKPPGMSEKVNRTNIKYLCLKNDISI